MPRIDFLPAVMHTEGRKRGMYKISPTQAVPAVVVSTFLHLNIPASFPLSEETRLGLIEAQDCCRPRRKIWLSL